MGNHFGRWIGRGRFWISILALMVLIPDATIAQNASPVAIPSETESDSSDDDSFSVTDAESLPDITSVTIAVSPPSTTTFAYDQQIPFSVVISGLAKAKDLAGFGYSVAFDTMWAEPLLNSQAQCSAPSGEPGQFCTVDEIVSSSRFFIHGTIIPDPMTGEFNATVTFIAIVPHISTANVSVAARPADADALLSSLTYFFLPIVPTSVPSPTATDIPTNPPTMTAEPTVTNTVAPTSTTVPTIIPEPTATATLFPSATTVSTHTPQATETLVPTTTPEPTATMVPTATTVPTNTPTSAPQPTFTSAPTTTPEPTATHIPTNTLVPTVTATLAPTLTPEPTSTTVPTSIPTVAPSPTASVIPSTTPTNIPESSATAAPTTTIEPTSTTVPANTPIPTLTTSPTHTPEPAIASTLAPTSSIEPSVPTATIAPTTEIPASTATTIALATITSPDPMTPEVTPSPSATVVVPTSTPIPPSESSQVVVFLTTISGGPTPENATVCLDDSCQSLASGAVASADAFSGNVAIFTDIPAGVHKLSVFNASPYLDVNQTITVSPNEILNITIQLDPVVVPTASSVATPMTTATITPSNPSNPLTDGSPITALPNTGAGDNRTPSNSMLLLAAGIFLVIAGASTITVRRRRLG